METKADIIISRSYNFVTFHLHKERSLYSMFNLLNGAAAAIGSMFSRKSMHGLNNSDTPRQSFFTWLYRLCCLYGMQIQRKVNMVIRKTKKILRPCGRFIARGFDSAVVQPVHTTKKTFAEIKEEFQTAKPRLDAAKKDGALSFAKAHIGAAAASAVKHRSFLASALNIILPVICVIILCTTISNVFSKNYALAVECGGETIGYIADETTFTEASQLVSSELLSTSAEIDKSLEPTYRLAAVEPNRMKNSTQLAESMLYGNEDIEEAYGLFIDGELVGAIRSEGDLSFILDEFTEGFTDTSKNGTFSFIQNVETKSGLFAAKDVVTTSELRDIIRGTKTVVKSHTVKSSNTVSKLLSTYGMTEERLYELNPGLEKTGLIAGETIQVETKEPMLEVKYVVVRQYTVSVKFNSTTVKDSTKYTTYKKLKTAGQKGTNKITEEIIYVGGVEQARKVIKTEVLKAPVDEVYVVGTKKPPSYSGGSSGGSSSSGGGRVPTGMFTWPVPGVKHVSSYYGMRWGKLHKGIDISTSGIYGRTVVAAASGKVTRAGWFSSYGYCVDIQHSSGYLTRYAHLSKISVSKGQYVSSGQAIGKVGNSGNSTGPHLHFEIRLNGNTKNPMNYYK